VASAFNIETPPPWRLCVPIGEVRRDQRYIGPELLCEGAQHIMYVGQVRVVKATTMGCVLARVKVDADSLLLVGWCA
jgi:hypothetical protein